MSERDKELLRDFNRYGIENRDKVLNDKDYHKVCEAVIKAMLKQKQIPVNDYELKRGFTPFEGLNTLFV